MSTDSALATLDHHHHRLRRGALNQFFSKKNVRDLQPVIEDRVDQVLDRFQQQGNERPTEPIDILYPFSAYTNGMPWHYVFLANDLSFDRYILWA